VELALGIVSFHDDNPTLAASSLVPVMPRLTADYHYHADSITKPSACVQDGQGLSKIL